VRRLVLSLAFLAVPMMAAQGDSVLGVTLVQNKGGASLGVPMQIVLLLTALTMLPAILMSVTPFLRSIVVLHFLRQALGTQTTPSNQVLVGLALFVSLLVMQPWLTIFITKAGNRSKRAKSARLTRGTWRRRPSKRFC